MNNFQNYYDSPASSLTCYFFKLYHTQPMEKCKTMISTFSFEKLRLLCLLSLFLFSGYIVRGQLNCSSAENITIGQLISGNTSGAQNNVESYTVYSEDGPQPAENFSGPEDIYSFYWPGGRFGAFFSNNPDDLKLFFLKEGCDPNQVQLSFATNGGASFDPGTYYIVVDGQNGAQGEYEFTLVGALTGENGACENATELPLDSPLSSDTRVEGFNRVLGTCGNNMQSGPEMVYKISSWPGGPFRASLDIDYTSFDGIDVIPNLNLSLIEDCSSVVGSCKGSSFVDNNATNNPQEKIEISDLPAGEYFLIVDGEGVFDAGSFTLIAGGAKPDYTITDMSASTSQVTQGESITVSGTYKNIGDAFSDGAPGAYGLFLSLDENFNYSPSGNLDEGDRFLDGFDLEPLNPDASASYEISAPIPTGVPNGTYYLIFVVDFSSRVDESNEDNNTRAIPITVGQEQKPDYQPTDFVARGGATTLQAGGSLVIDLKIRNNGPVDGQGNGGKDKYYFNTTPDLNGNPIFLREFGTADIAANSSFDVNSGPLEIPAATTPGTYYIVFFHDADNQIDESNEDNNIAYLEITVETPGSGFAVDFSASEREICEGESVQFSAQVTAGSSLPIVYDQSGKENNGAMENFGSEAFEERPNYGKALNFDGEDDFIVAGDVMPKSYTKEAWINVTEAGTQNIISGNNSSQHAFWVLNGKISAGHDGAWDLVQDPNPVETGWHHYAVTYDEASRVMKLFKNGEKIDGNSDAVPIAGDSHTVFIGSYNNSALFEGKMDEVRIWNKARTELEIAANWNRELAGTDPALIVYYNFNREILGSYYWEVLKEASIISTSQEVNPSFSFTDAGTYSVSLTVTSNGQTDSEVKESYITVEDCSMNLTVDFSADNTTPCVGESVQFTSAAIIGNTDQVSDLSGNGNDGTLNGFQEQPYVERENYGNALEFDGIDDFIDAEDIMPKSYTKEVWINMEMNNGKINNIISGQRNHVLWAPVSNGYKVSAGHNGDWNSVEDPEPVISGWQHYAVTYDEGTKVMKLFKNGVKIDEAQDIPPFTGDTEKILVGSFRSIALFQGMLDEVRVWNRERTEAEIAANWNKELTGNEAGLLVYYSFNSTSDLTYIWDFSGGTPSSSTEANPTVTYSTPGTYNVGLVVRNSSNQNEQFKTAYITVQGCEPEWPVIETVDNHLVFVPANADITLEGQTIAVGDYIGAFYNDNGTLKCAGKAQWTGENLSIAVFGDDLTTSDAKEGFEISENFQWKLWKASSNQELYGDVTYTVPNGIITHTGQFAINGVSQISRLIGTTEPPQLASQTITLEPGWNLISSYIKATVQDIGTIFDPIQSNIIIVKNDQGDVYMPNPAINSIGDWNIVDGYQVKVMGNTPVALTLSGQKANLLTTPIPFSEGHNLFAYLKETEQDVQTVMAPIANEVEVVKDIKGRAYVPSLNINNIGNMKPGQGYWAKMKTAVNLNYTARMATPPAVMHYAQLVPSRYNIERRGTHNATIILDTKGLVSYGDEVGIFDKAGKLVGAATYEDHILAFSIWGDDPATAEIEGLEEGDEFEIRVWENATATEKVFAFNANVDIYTTHSVIEAELLRTTNVPSLLEANSLKLYPNPTRDNATLSLELTAHASVQATLFDLTGKRVLDIVNENMTAGIHQAKINTAQLPAGLYHCRIVVDGHPHNIQLSVVK